MTDAVIDIPVISEVYPQTDTRFRTDFRLDRILPGELRILENISANFFWSWNPDGAELFRELDPGLWEQSEQNPRVLLKNVSEVRLWQKAADANYIRRLWSFNERFEQYMAQSAGASEPSLASIAYFCAEYGIHNSLPNY